MLDWCRIDLWIYLYPLALAQICPDSLIHGWEVMCILHFAHWIGCVACLLRCWGERDQVAWHGQPPRRPCLVASLGFNRNSLKWVGTFMKFSRNNILHMPAVWNVVSCFSPEPTSCEDSEYVLWRSMLHVVRHVSTSIPFIAANLKRTYMFKCALDLSYPIYPCSCDCHDSGLPIKRSKSWKKNCRRTRPSVPWTRLDWIFSCPLLLSECDFWS